MTEEEVFLAIKNGALTLSSFENWVLQIDAEAYIFGRKEREAELKEQIDKIFEEQLR